MTISVETQKILDQLKTIQQTNGQVTIQDLRQAFSDLIPTVAQDLANKNTLFYAGQNPADPLYVAAKNISKDVNNPLIIMGSTQFNDLMYSDEVKSYLQEIADKNNIAKYTDIMEYETTIDGVNSPALWDDASEALAKASSGDVRTLTPFGTENKVFARVELPALIENPNVKTIDGIPRETLKAMYDADIANGLSHADAIDNARAAVQAKSLVYASLIDEITNANGKVTGYDVSRFIDGPNNLFDPSKIATVTANADTSLLHSSLLGDPPSTALLSESQIGFLERGVTQLERAELVTQQLAQNLPVLESTHFLNLAKGVGYAGIAIGMLVLNAEVNAAETPQQKQQVIDDWVAHTTADTIAGSIGSALLVGGATVALATITTLSSPVIIGLAIAGGIAGSVLWGDNVHDYIKDGVDRVIENIKNAIRDLIGNDTDLSEVANLYEEAEHITSPLILDLNRDGVVETTALRNGVYFDHDGSGYKEKTGWVGQQDGLLVLDKNNSQNIESGQELFGNYTTLENGQFALNGFDALAAYDLNQDGVIDVSDDIYTHLQVWQDSNQDGQVDAGELKSLQEHEIQHINLFYTQRNNFDAQGNIHKQLGKFVWSDGTEGKIDDVWFKIDTLNSQVDKNKIVIGSDIIQALPDIQQFGNVDSLHQAMAKDSTGGLQQLVEQFVETDSLTLRQKLITDIIYQWTEVTDLPAHERGMYWDDRHLYALEKIMGHEYHSSADPERTLQVGNNQAYALEQAWKLLQQKIYDQLYIQIELPQIFNHIQIVQKNNAIETDLNQLYLYIKQQSVTEIVELYDVLSRGPQLFHDIQNGLKQIASTSIHPDLIDQILNQTLQVHIPEAKDGFYTGTENNDLLVSSISNDIFDGGYGINYYLFTRGSGQDTIQSAWIDENSPQTETYILLDLLPQNLQVSIDSEDVVLNIMGSEDQLRIEQAFSENSIFKTIIFADQTIWNIENLKIQGLTGTAQDDFIQGFENRDNIIYGNAGNDTLYGQNGNDQLCGDDGDDQLYAGDGDDLLRGGVGSDVLDGGYGINTYIFNHGDGQDTIQSVYLDENSLLTETHILLGVLPNDIELEIQYSTDLLIKIKNTEDQLLIRDIFNTSSIFKSLTFVDQSIWSLEDIKNFSLIGNEQDNFIEGYENRNNTIYGNAGNDTLYGQNGNDQLYGGNDDDYLVGNEGNDQLYGGSGTNILIGGKGDDQYVIENSTDEIIENAKEGIDTVQSSVSFTLGSYIENLALVGSSAINGIGNSLANTLKGNSANNTLNGGAGNDYIESGAGNDKLLGGNGKDVLNGGLGNDQYTGGTGADIVIYELLVSSDAVGGNGNDNWTDFTVGNITANMNADKIDISELIIGYTGNYSSSNLEPFIKTVVNGSNTQLYIDRDGSGSMYNNSLFLTLNNVNTHLNDLINNQQIIV